MADQGDSTAASSSRHDSASVFSPLTPSRPSRVAIPVGTVASRIIDWQKLVTAPTPGRPRLSVVHRREHSRTGFGRRTNSRFGQPASVSTKPNEEVQIDAKHSFLGLAARRTNHMEEHALADGTSRLVRTAGLHGQLIPNGLGTRLQYEATSPWGFSSKKKSSNSTQRKYSEHETYSVEPCNQKNQLDIAVSNLTDYDGAEGRKGCIGPNERKDDPSTKWVSMETTTTMRRQSVRDLYHYHGIGRPDGLVSSENTSDDPGAIPVTVNLFSYCKVCFGVNEPDSTNCRCGHPLLDALESLSHASKGKKEGSSHHHENGNKQCQKPGEKYPKQNLQIQTPSVDRVSGYMREGYSPPVSFPILHFEEATPQHTSKTTLPGTIRQSKRIDVSRESSGGSEKTKRITVSPFLTDDSVSPTYSLGLIPIAMRVSRHHSQKPHHGRSHSRRPQNQAEPQANSFRENACYTETDFDRSSHAETIHARQLPYRQSISSTRKRQRYPNDTDSGYVAGASHHDEIDTAQQMSTKQLASQVTEPSSSVIASLLPSPQPPTQPILAPKPQTSRPDPQWLRDPGAADLQEKVSQTCITEPSQVVQATVQSRTATPNGPRSETNSFQITQAPVIIPSTDTGSQNHPKTSDSDQGFGKSITPVTGPISECGTPRMFKTSSRRLSVFLKLQEQNIVPLLNKKLREHQEELKRIERLCQEQINTVAQQKCLHTELDQDQTSTKTLETTNIKDLGHGEIARYPGLSISAVEKDMMKSEDTTMTIAVDLPGEEHECTCKQTIQKGEPITCVSNITKIKDHEKEKGREAGINGITIVIHLQGREDIVVKADLRQGA